MSEEFKLEFTLLENGLDFIHQSLRDFRTAENTEDAKTKKSSIKYAMLHLSSGIELILKDYLLKKHWTYIFSDMNKASIKSMETGDFQSVNLTQIFSRLNDLCNIKIDGNNEKTLERLRKTRNKLEHFECKEHILSFAKLINDSIDITTNLIVEYYDNIETEEEKGLFMSIKDELRESKDFYDKALNLAKRAAYEDKGEGYVFLQCPECSAELLTHGDASNVSCFFCDYTETPENAADLYISNILMLNHYRVVKEGGEWPLHTCPECDCESLVDTGECYICFNCNQVHEKQIYTHCSYCGLIIRFDEDEDEIDICSDCFKQIINKG